MQAVKERSRRFLRGPVRRTLLVFVGLGLLLGCRPEASSGDIARMRCDGVVRRPRDLSLVALGPEGLPASRQPCFGQPLCVDGAVGAVALPAARGRFRVRIGALERTHEVNWALPMVRTTRLAGFAVSDTAALLASRAGLEVIELASGKSHRFALPRLAAEEHVVHAFVIEGGVGIKVTLGDAFGAPEALRWLHRPDVFPYGERFFAREGRVLGWLERAGGGWMYVSRAGGRRAALPGSAAAAVPGVFEGQGFLLYTTDRGVAVLDEEGGVRVLQTGQTRRLVTAREEAFVVDDEAGVFRVTARGEVPLSRAAPGLDLAGAPLPAGALRERIQLATDWGRKLLAIERLRQPSCRAEDRVHLLDLGSGRWRTVARGDAVRMHPTWGAGNFYFVEGKSEYRFWSLEPE